MTSYKGVAACRSTCSQLKNDGHVSSDTYVGVLTAIIGHVPAPPEEGTFRHRSGSNSAPHHYYTDQGNEIPLTNLVASHPRTRGAPYGGQSHRNYFD
ncbi:hypothetical protein AVEN_149859-1 [Araneus ventricosus]|uniref:Uncharacterized protein n=1 Tax=Araneus ventricosus TaxID=182803 RepID=A0A4Y2DWN3_ARAVE|nr:hypothetical protein AVEN_149859-1 [Araneus ventricosus]